MSEEYAPATANRILSALRGVLKEAWRLGYMTAEDYQRSIDIKNVRGDTVPAGRELAQREISKLVAVCRDDGDSISLRDRAIIGLLYTCGLRRAEVVALDVSDYDAESGKLTVRAGKGRKQRTVYVTGGAAAAFWLQGAIGNLSQSQRKTNRQLEHAQVNAESSGEKVRALENKVATLEKALDSALKENETLKTRS